jgi:hypothetical protein
MGGITTDYPFHAECVNGWTGCSNVGNRWLERFFSAERRGEFCCADTLAKFPSRSNRACLFSPDKNDLVGMVPGTHSTQRPIR